MRELGRDALWFDYLSDAADATPDLVRRFDAVIVDAPAERFPLLAGVPASRRIEAESLGAPDARASPPTRESGW